MPKKHVFLSYCHDNEAEVGQLRADLLAEGEAVWWDKDILAGQDWKQENSVENGFDSLALLSKLEVSGKCNHGFYWGFWTGFCILKMRLANL